MQLSPNHKMFSQFFAAFQKFTQNLEHFREKDKPSKLFDSELIDCPKRGYLNAEKAPCHSNYGQSTC